VNNEIDGEHAISGRGCESRGAVLASNHELTRPSGPSTPVLIWKERLDPLRHITWVSVLMRGWPNLKKAWEARRRYWLLSGAAHGNTKFNTFNFLLSPLIELRIEDLFLRDSGYLAWLRDLCRRELLKHEGAVEEAIVRGTASERENYRVWALSESGFRVCSFNHIKLVHLHGVLRK
jgi:hypothetical protein